MSTAETINRAEISITGEPISDASCRFVVDRPVYPNRAFYFANKDDAQGSPLGERIFAVEGVAAVQVTHDRVTVRKAGTTAWPAIGKQIGDAIRDFLCSGEPAVTQEVLSRLPSEDEIRQKVQQVLETEINPAIQSHGGIVRLVDVKENIVFLQMGGGCQGCGQANVTLKMGVESSLRAAVPGIGDVIDVTDHAAGTNPYYR